MKTTNLLFLMLMIPFLSFSQIQGEDEVYLSGDRIEAKFNGGGLDKFYEYINKEFDYTKVTKAGKMLAAFTIDEEGAVVGIKIVEMLDVESATEMIRVLKKCPKWEPAMRGGKPISIEIKYPMVFTVKAKPLQTVIPSANTSSSDENKLFATEVVEKKPDFPGGLTEFYNYVGKNFKVPEVKGLSGRIIVSFVVEKDGSITDIKVIKDIGYGTGNEAIRILKACPKWIPGEQFGKKVRVIYRLPLSIKANN